MKSTGTLLADPFVDADVRKRAYHFFDETIPRFVKLNYSKQKSWADKPFSEQDAKFFFKGIEELSSLFTEERERWSRTYKGSYFSHPRFRSAYLLYFLPLQFSKFLTLFESYRVALGEILKSAKKNKVLRLGDFGAGPATATLAFLIYAGEALKTIDRIEIDLVDTEGSILKDGERLIFWALEKLGVAPEKIAVRCFPVPLEKFEIRHDYDLIIWGHLLNELKSEEDAQFALLQKHQAHSAAGVLVVEPASPQTSQRLAKLRDLFEVRNFLGPCLHNKDCPLTRGRDYCNFSAPVQIRARWFADFSRRLGSERRLLRFSFLWVQGSLELKSSHLLTPETKLVLSDPIKMNPKSAKVLICTPDRVATEMVTLPSKFQRGDFVVLKSKPISNAQR